MVKLLPFVLVPLVIIAGLGYWRFVASVPKVSTVANQAEQASPEVAESGPVEVPKTLPQASVEERISSLETTLTKLIPQVNSLKSGGSPASSGSLESKLKEVEVAIADLKGRMLALEKATPLGSSTTQPTIYIPMGSTAGPWSNTDWSTLGEYEISLDPANYPGYSGMNLEVNFRLVDPAGTGSVRLYNVTDSSVVSSELNTSSTGFSLKTSTSFKLAIGQKTYKLQVKSTGGKDLYIQSARIRVNF